MSTTEQPQGPRTYGDTEREHATHGDREAAYPTHGDREDSPAHDTEQED